jgi:hypothetical protein
LDITEFTIDVPEDDIDDFAQAPGSNPLAAHLARAPGGRPVPNRA